MDSMRIRSSCRDINLNAVTPDYFATMRTRILRGRGIDSTDVARRDRASIVVSNRLAKALWPGETRSANA